MNSLTRDEKIKREEALIHAVKNLDPTESIDSTDPRYVDCVDVRGEEGKLIKEIGAKIHRAFKAGRKPFTLLFSGHNGSGKSTELRTLQNELEEKNLFPIKINALEVIDVDDPGYIDILFTIAVEIERQLREKNMPLPEDLVDNITGWFGEVIYEKTSANEIAGEIKAGVDMKINIPLISKLFAHISGRLKTSSNQRKIIRRKLDPRVSQLMGLINLMITQAEAVLQKNNYLGMVIIYDNLEKMKLAYVGSKESPKTTHETIFIDNYHNLTGLLCHKIYTIPLALLYSHHHTRLVSLYDADYVLPMVKVCKTRSRKPDMPGIRKLIDIAKRRMDTNEFFKSESLLNDIALFSGGNVREFIRILGYLVDAAKPEDLPLTSQNVNFTFRRVTRDFDTAPSDEDVEKLVKVYQTFAISNDIDHYRMINNHFILAYINGEPWYDVNPAMQQVDKFKKTLAKLSGDRAKNMTKPGD
jgi:hypothetical protein